MPREHGAWGMVLLPFVSAWILARAGDWAVLAALAAVLATFLIREPLLVLLRQRYRWTDRRAETAAAVRTLAVLVPLLAASGLSLALAIPIAVLSGLVALAVVLTGVYLWGAMNNLQRSPWLQAAGALGLSSSALLCYAAAGRELDHVVFLLWGVHVVHSTGSVLAVHARLEAILAQRRGQRAEVRRTAAAAALGGGAVSAVGLALAGYPLLAAAVAFPIAVHIWDLRRLGDPAFLKIKLHRVGIRELAISIAFSAAAVLGLW